MLVILTGLITLSGDLHPPQPGPRTWAGVTGDSRQALRDCPPEQSGNQLAHNHLSPQPHILSVALPLPPLVRLAQAPSPLWSCSWSQGNRGTWAWSVPLHHDSHGRRVCVGLSMAGLLPLAQATRQRIPEQRREGTELVSPHRSRTRLARSPVEN